MPFWIMEISANLDTRCRKSRDASNADKGAILKRGDQFWATHKSNDR